MGENEHKFVRISYRGMIVAIYSVYNINNGKCDITLNLYYPFKRHETILSNISINNSYREVLNYMSLQLLCGTEDRDKLFAFEVLEHLKFEMEGN